MRVGQILDTLFEDQPLKENPEHFEIVDAKVSCGAIVGFQAGLNVRGEGDAPDHEFEFFRAADPNRPCSVFASIGPAKVCRVSFHQFEHQRRMCGDAM